MSRSDASHRLVSSRCPACGAPVDFRNVPRDQAQVKCTYCGTLINIPGRSLDRSRTATPPPNTPPTARVFVTSEPKRVRVHGGCSAIPLLILGLLLLLAGLAVWSTSFMTSAVRWVNPVIHTGSPDDVRGFQPISLPPIKQAFAPLRLEGNENAPVQMVIAAYQEDGSLLLGFTQSQASTPKSLYSVENHQLTLLYALNLTTAAIEYIWP